MPVFLYAALLCAALLRPAPLYAAETGAPGQEAAEEAPAEVTPAAANTPAAAPVGAAAESPPALRGRLVDAALSYTGTRYTYAGTSRRGGFDCSGLVYRVYLDVIGVRFPRMVEALFREGEPVAKHRLLPGDLVFFNTLGYVSHVGMYIGEGNFVHAENEKNGVIVTSLSSNYYTRTYVGAKRHLPAGPAGDTGGYPTPAAARTGGREQPSPYADFDGHFTSFFGPMTLQVLDPFGNVRGEYRNRDGTGRLWGKIDLDQQAFIGRWSHTNNRGSVQGEVRFYLTEDGKGLSGYWRKQGQRIWQDDWDAVKR